MAFGRVRGGMILTCPALRAVPVLRTRKRVHDAGTKVDAVCSHGSSCRAPVVSRRLTSPTQPQTFTRVSTKLFQHSTRVDQSEGGATVPCSSCYLPLLFREGMIEHLQSFQQTRKHSKWKHLLQTKVRNVTHPTCTEMRPIAYP